MNTTISEMFDNIMSDNKTKTKFIPKLKVEKKEEKNLFNIYYIFILLLFLCIIYYIYG